MVHVYEMCDFMGGQMLTVFFRAPGFYQATGKPRSWQYWAVNRERRGLTISIDGGDQLACALQLPPGTKPSDRKSTRLNSSHMSESRMPSSA